MGLFDLPDPIGMYESAKTAGLEREIANVFVSSTYSAWMTGLWKGSTSRVAAWLGLTDTMQSMARATYLSLRELESKQLLVLTVPTDLMKDLSGYQTERMTK